MTDQPKLPPAERERRRIEALIRGSDLKGNSAPFDPWPYAAAWVAYERIPSNQHLIALRQLEPAFHQFAGEYEGPFLRGPRMQAVAAQECLRNRAAIEGGDGGLLLDAVMQCAAHGLVMPGWLAEQYAKRWHAVNYGDAKTGWGDPMAFGRAFPPGTDFRTIVAKQQIAPWAYETAQQLLSENPKLPLDPDFYSQVGERIGRGHSSTEELIKEYVETNHFAMPLLFLKSRLASGDTIDDAAQRWRDSRRKEFYERVRNGSPMDPEAFISPAGVGVVRSLRTLNQRKRAIEYRSKTDHKKRAGGLHDGKPIAQTARRRVSSLRNPKKSHS